MPLTRANVTAASRVMLPTYVAFFGSLGINYLTTQPAALASPTLAFANEIMPLQAWGGLFVSCAGLMVVALILHQRILYRFALRMCGLAMVVWAVIIAFASVAGDATMLASNWPLFVALACLASDRSLAAGER